MARYLMTAKRKAALRKAQLASARKRRKNYRKANKESRSTVSKAYVKGKYGGRLAAGIGVAQYRAKRDYAWKKHNNAVKYKGKKQLTRKQANRRFAAKQVGTFAAYYGASAATAAFQYAGKNPLKVAAAGRTARQLPGAVGAFGKGFARGYGQSRARRAAAKRNMARVNFGYASSVRVAQPALPRRGSSTRRVRGY